MICIITGDVINSKRNSPKAWLSPLKKELNKVGKSPKFWEIYRGDSFQVMISNPNDALMTAIKIKATLKCIQGINVRMSIGM
ncbi:MAG: hypothetical protein ABIR03_11690 [Ginsengibacter sp.]